MTPLERSQLAGGVWLKREDRHELGAFKWRGAAAVLAARRPEVVVTASTGNHGAATAWAARRAGIRAVVFVPEGASATKSALIEAQGAELRRAGADVGEAKEAAQAFAAGEGWFFFEDGAEPAQFDGYATIGQEIVDQLGEEPGSVVVPVGNGALAIGVFRTFVRRAPRALRVAVAAAAAPAMWESWQARRPVDGDGAATFADGLAVRVAIPLAVAELNPLVQRFELVSERSLALALGDHAAAGARLEAAAAAPLAVASRESLPRPVVLVVTGRNIDDELWRRAVESPDSFPA